MRPLLLLAMLSCTACGSAARTGSSVPERVEPEPAASEPPGVLFASAVPSYGPRVEPSPAFGSAIDVVGVTCVTRRPRTPRDRADRIEAPPAGSATCEAVSADPAVADAVEPIEPGTPPPAPTVRDFASCYAPRRRAATAGVIAAFEGRLPRDEALMRDAAGRATIYYATHSVHTPCSHRDCFMDPSWNEWSYPPPTVLVVDPESGTIAAPAWARPPELVTVSVVAGPRGAERVAERLAAGDADAALALARASIEATPPGPARLLALENLATAALLAREPSAVPVVDPGFTEARGEAARRTFETIGRWASGEVWLGEHPCAEARPADTARE